jgi:hypothetical protein
MVHRKKVSRVQKTYWGGSFETKSGELVEVPPYIAVMNKDFIKVRTSDFMGSHVTEIHRRTSEGYRGEMGSGYATFAGIGGDWRQMQGLAEEVNFIFKKLKEMV